MQKLSQTQANSDDFVPQEQRIQALGNIEEVKDPLLKEILINSENLYPAKKIYQEDDWLLVRKESGQTFDQFVKDPSRNKVTKTRNTIYLHILDHDIEQSFKAKLLAYCRAFYYGMNVQMTEPKSKSFMESNQIKSRKKWGITQYHAGQILEKTIQQVNVGVFVKQCLKMVPKTGFCMLSVTTEDIYPNDKMNFVFGLASLQNRTGVFSFKRYDPEFQGIQDPQRDQTLLRNACKVMVHEIGHMFMLKHCIYYECTMNGSNSYQESCRMIRQLCPVCLRKLQHAIKFNTRERYQALLEVSKTLEMEWDYEFYEKILSMGKSDE